MGIKTGDFPPSPRVTAQGPPEDDRHGGLNDWLSNLSCSVPARRYGNVTLLVRMQIFVCREVVTQNK